MNNEQDEEDNKGAINSLQVKQYLLQHPDFLMDYPELLPLLQLPKEWQQADNASKIVDFRSALIGNLQHQISMTDQENDELFSVVALNHDYQQRIYQLVLLFLQCDSLFGLTQLLSQQMPKILQLKKIVLCVVPHPDYEELLQDIYFEHLHNIDASFLQLFANDEVLQRENITGEAEIYGADDISSDLLVAIDFYKCRAFIAYGSDTPNHFTENLSTDLMVFLTKSFAAMIKLLTRDHIAHHQQKTDNATADNFMDNA